MSYDPFQALYSGTGGVLLLLLTTIESTYPTVCVTSEQTKNFIIFHHIILYDIRYYFNAGGHRGPGVSVTNEDTSPKP